MRYLITVCVLCLMNSVIHAQEFKNSEAITAKQQYAKDLEAARLKYAKSLEDVAKKSLEDDKLEEAIQLKKMAEEIRTGKGSTSTNSASKSLKRVLWKHKGGYFEKLNDGYWVERVPSGVAHIFAQGTVTDDYVEISRTTASKTIVRMYSNRCTFLRQGKRGFEPLYKGSWEQRKE